MKLTKNSDLHNLEYSDYGIGFDPCSQFSLSSGEWAKTIVIFGVNNSLSAHADNRKNRY